MGSSDAASTGPRFFDSLDLAGSGLLSFQGLSRGDGLLIRLTTRQGERSRDRPCRLAVVVKSTLGPVARIAALVVA